jgi:hypothetical protein
MVASLDGELDVVGEQVSRLGHAAIAGIDIAGQDQRLRPGATFGQALRHQRQIGPNLNHAFPRTDQPASRSQ